MEVEKGKIGIEKIERDASQIIADQRPRIRKREIKCLCHDFVIPRGELCRVTFGKDSQENRRRREEDSKVDRVVANIFLFFRKQPRSCPETIGGDEVRSKSE